MTIFLSSLVFFVEYIEIMLLKKLRKQMETNPALRPSVEFTAGSIGLLPVEIAPFRGMLVNGTARCVIIVLITQSFTSSVKRASFLRLGCRQFTSC